MNEISQLSLEEFLELKSYPFFLGSSSAKDPSWEIRHPGQLLNNIVLRLFLFTQKSSTISGRSVIGLLSCVPYSWFEKWSSLEGGKEIDEEYERVKQVIGQKFVNQAAHFYPKIKVS